VACNRSRTLSQARTEMSIEEQLSEADIQALYDDYIREMQEGDSK